MAFWALTYVCTQNAITFWKEFAMAERSFSAEDVGHTLTLGALGSLPLLFLTGRLLDRLGRRVGGVLIFLTCIVGTVCAYTLNTRIGLGFAVVAGIYGTNAVLPVLNAYTAELFPTERRADAFALANSMLGRVGYVLSPIAVGMAAESWGWGPSVAATAVGPTLALLLLWALLPETRGRELEETSR
jgi:putative MFS transporter